MATKLIQQHTRNDFSFLGLTEKYLQENPDYITVYDFERHDYVPYYWWFTNNIHRVSSVAAFYLIGVFSLQRWMKNRKAFNLRVPLFFWNIFLAALSMIMFSRLLPEVLYINQKYGFYRSYCKRDHFNSATIFWVHIYSATKILEFMDTAFIILRKQRLTFLHVFHHTSVYFACVFGTLRADPVSRYFALMNTFVHSVMYTYYALKAAQFKLPRKLAMCVTAVQLIQFTFGTLINVLVPYAKVMGTEPHCERPLDISVFYFLLELYYLYLFGNFFLKSYFKKIESSAIIKQN